MADVCRYTRSLLGSGTLSGLRDGQLVDRFVEGRDEPAFEELLRRHGPLVLGLCRRWLERPDDVEDAFQATFLILVRKAGSLRDRERLGNWLYGVARRVASRARASASRRQLVERLAAGEEIQERDASQISEQEELISALHDGIFRLPSKYRSVVVACWLEGMTQEEAAHQLGWPLGTVKSRLAWARRRLEYRLTRGRRSPTLAPLLAALPQEGARLALPPALIASTIRSASSWLVPGQAVQVISARILTLSQGVIRAMFLKNLFIGVAGLSLGLAFTGTAIWGGRTEPGRPSAPLSVAQAAGNSPTQAKTSQRPTEPAARDVIVRQALSIAHAIQDPAERAEMLLRLGWAYIRRGEVAAARDTLESAREAAAAIKPDASHVIPHPMIRVAEAQAAAGQQQAAQKTFDQAVSMIEAENESRQIDDWINLIRIQRDSMGHAGTKATFQAYQKYLGNQAAHHTPWGDAVGLLIAYAGAGDVESALRKIRDPKTFQETNRADHRLCALLGILDNFDSGEQQAARPIVAEARKAIDNDSDIVNVSRLNTLAGTEARLGLFQEAIATASAIDPSKQRHEEMVSSAGFQKAMAFAEIAERQVKAGDKAGARASARRAITVVNQIQSESYRTYPLERAARVLIDACDIEGARLALEDSRRADSKFSILRQIGEAQARQGDQAGARETLQKALSRARVLRLRSQAARIQARLGDLPAAMKTIESFANEQAKDQAMLELAGDRAEVGDLETVRTLIEKIKSPELKRRAWIQAACALPASNSVRNG